MMTKKSRRKRERKRSQSSENERHQMAAQKIQINFVCATKTETR